MADEARGDGTPMHESEIRTGESTSPDEGTTPLQKDGPALQKDGTALQKDGTAGEPGGSPPIEETGRRPSQAWWAPAGRFGRYLLGALSLVGGLTWILLNMHGPSALLDTLVGFVLAAGGLVLLMPHRIVLPRLVTAAAMTVAALAGSAAGLLAQKTKVCCSFAYVEDRGWPVTWVQRGAVADDSDTAQRLAGSADWTVDLIALATDLLLWAYAGMLLVVVVVLVRRARAARERPQA